MGQSGRGLRAANKSQDVKRQVDSDDKNQIPIYQLINVKNGGGKLIEIIKSTAKHSGSGSEFNQTFSCNTQLANSNNKPLDTSEHLNSVDRQIHDLVEPLLYNGGRGKLIPLSRIWMSRMGRTKEMHDDDDNDGDDGDRAPGGKPNSGGGGGRHRWVCWRLEERGFVGETALHICFLLSTPTHMILAKKLLSLFPMLINDIYTCDEYFGESSMHMAIVNEDIRIVKLLLDHGANVHQRCLGSFFLPFDQKDRANDTIRSLHQENEKDPSIVGAKLNQFDLESNQLMGLATNYNGYAYWGEYPLSFAACLGLTDCYKLLLAKGANPNRQDSNGNSTLHMAVIADRIDVFDLCYSTGANLDLLNWQKLNPLTLAAKLKRVNMFFHILTIQRQVNWIFCNVGFAETPLAGIDSINSQDGSCDENSALSIVVFGASTEHLQMLDGLLDQLLTIKWTTAARKRFRLWLCQFLLFMLISMVAYCGRFRVALAGKETDTDRYLISISQLENIYEYSQYAVICFVVYYLWAILSRIVSKFTLNSIISSLAQAPEISIFFVTCLLILICIPLRCFGLREAENIVAALVMFTLPLKFLFFCRASKSVGPFVVVIYKCVSNDVLCFIVLLAIFVAGFSQSLQIIFKSHYQSTNLTLNATTTIANSSVETIDRNYFNNVLDGIVSMHMMALNEFGFVFDEFNSTDYPKLAKLLFIIYMILVSILLINMIIAMLGKTYQDIVSQPNENLRQWARALLIVERMMWTKSERLGVLDRYSHRPAGDSHCGRHFGFTWALSERDCQDINHSKKLKADNLRYAPRLARRQHDDGSEKLPH